MIPIGHIVIDFCPHCEAERLSQKVQIKETYDYKGERIEVMSRFLVCQKCFNDFEDLKDPYDAAAEILKEYARRCPPTKK